MSEVDLEYIKKFVRYEKRTGKFFWLHDRRGHAKSGEEAGTVDKYNHRIIKIKQKRYRAHRMVWLFETGVWPEQLLDHKNTDGDDNRFKNLRLANESLNGFNRGVQSNNTSGYKNVFWDVQKCKWRVSLNCGGRQIHGGFFNKKRDAAAAAKLLREKHHGEYACHKR